MSEKDKKETKVSVLKATVGIEPYYALIEYLKHELDKDSKKWLDLSLASAENNNIIVATPSNAIRKDIVSKIIKFSAEYATAKPEAVKKDLKQILSMFVFTDPQKVINQKRNVFKESIFDADLDLASFLSADELYFVQDLFKHDSFVLASADKALPYLNPVPLS